VRNRKAVYIIDRLGPPQVSSAKKSSEVETRMDRRFSWYCEPPRWNYNNGRLSVVTGKATDFWQSTYYGFRRDDGHLYYTDLAGDFSAEVRVTGRYEALYDQAGLMLRVDPCNWIKAGLEFTDGALHFSTVITRDGFSDWSVTPLGKTDEPVRIRLTRHGEALRVQYENSGSWIMARLGYLAMPSTVSVGPMACSPQREGFQVDFEALTIGAPIDRQLHAD
jgi:regulation of enolase protein 1 (concanavalin A-like superfamily)